MGFQWVIEAKERGATVMHVDPRYTRTSAMADLHVPLRPGSDIAFLGGVINHILSGGHEFTEYVRHYTNARVIIDERFRDTEELDGLFSGWTRPGAPMTHPSWAYARKEGGVAQEELEPAAPQLRLSDPQAPLRPLHAADGGARLRGGAAEAARGRRDAVSQLRARAHERDLLRGRWTQHSHGVQNIRAAAIIQLLLGNIGRPGGNILALRGHANIQGSTDIPTLFDILPGYIPMPRPGRGVTTCAPSSKAVRARHRLWGRCRLRRQPPEGVVG